MALGDRTTSGRIPDLFPSSFPRSQIQTKLSVSKMKENQPSLEPVLVIQNDDPNGIDKLKNFMKENGII